MLWEFVWEGIPWPFPRKVVDAGLAMQDTDTGFFSRNSDGTAGDPMVRAPAVTICSEELLWIARVGWMLCFHSRAQ